MHLVYLMNVYGPGLSILFVVFVEAAGVCWLYGTDNFARDIEKMLGHRPGIFWRICWKYISPFFLLVITNSILNHLLISNLLSCSLLYCIVLSGNFHIFAVEPQGNAWDRI